MPSCMRRTGGRRRRRRRCSTRCRSRRPTAASSRRPPRDRPAAAGRRDRRVHPAAHRRPAPASGAADRRHALAERPIAPITTATARSTSASVVVRPSVIRTRTARPRRSTPIAASTCERSSRRSRTPTPPTRTRRPRRAGTATPRCRRPRRSRCADPAHLGARGGTVSRTPTAPAHHAGDQAVAQRADARTFSTSRSASAAAIAAAMATMPPTLWVPLRRSRSWPPPTMQRIDVDTGAHHGDAHALGPPNLWALSVSTSTCGQIWRRSSHPAAWTASVWNTASGALERTSGATGAEVGDGADLVVDRHDRHHADALGAAGEGLLEGVTQGASVDAGQRVDVDDGAAVTLDHVQHGVVLGGRADGAPGAAAQGAGDGGVVALGAATR